MDGSKYVPKLSAAQWLNIVFCRCLIIEPAKPSQPPLAAVYPWEREQKTTLESVERRFWPSLPDPQISQWEAKICVIQTIRAKIHGSQQWSWPYIFWLGEKPEGHLVSWCFSSDQPSVRAGLPVMATPLRREVVHHGLNIQSIVYLSDLGLCLYCQTKSALTPPG